MTGMRLRRCCLASRRLRPHEPLDVIGDAREAGEIDAVGRVGRSVIVAVVAGRDVHRGDAARDEGVVVGSATAARQEREREPRPRVRLNRE